MMSGRSLPLGYSVRIRPDVRVAGSGVFIGGTPTRILRLKPAAHRLLRDGVLTVGDDSSALVGERLLDSGIADPVAESLAPVSLDQLTVVVPVHDRSHQLARLLASLPDGLASVIVVDDASTERAAIREVVSRAGAELVVMPRNLGPAGARNAGITRARTPFIGFIDSDVVVVPGALEILLAHFADPSLALAAPRVSGVQHADDNWIVRYENARSSLDLGPRPALVRPRGAISWVSSTCLVARAEALTDGFDDAMRVGEDVDLVWRLVDAGWRVRYDPAAVVHHEHRSTLRAWLSRKFFYGTGASDLGSRHPHAIAPVILPPWAAIALASLVAQRRWSALAAAVLCVSAVLRVAARVRPLPNLPLEALRLVGQGVVAALGQGAALILRHWWPVTALLIPVSRRARRAALVAVVLDAVWELRRLRPRLDLIRFLVARRLDDAAYGAGVWWSALRDRRVRALVPDLAGSRQAGRRTARSSRGGPQTDGLLSPSSGSSGFPS